jgi:hypothetical protein
MLASRRDLIAAQFVEACRAHVLLFLCGRESKFLGLA